MAHCEHAGRVDYLAPQASRLGSLPAVPDGVRHPSCLLCPLISHCDHLSLNPKITEVVHLVPSQVAAITRRHGYGKWEAILMDPDLNFLTCAQEYEQEVRAVLGPVRTCEWSMCACVSVSSSTMQGPAVQPVDRA